MSKVFVLAPDSFKESMTAKEACEAMEKGIRRVFKEAKIISIPMADGGEGTVDALVDATKGQRLFVDVAGPIPTEKVRAYYGLLGDKKTAVIEMAKANGLELLSPNRRNPLVTSTYGTGELIQAALDQQVDKIIIGIGGSATNDGGAGMASALGVRFFDQTGQELPLGGGYLKQLDHIDVTQLDPRLKEVEIIVACDVNNPLIGEKGASHVFGPQKGGSAEMISVLEDSLSHYGTLIEKELGVSVINEAGAGAAGGLGAGLLAFTSAKLKSGIDIVTEQVQLAKYISEADYVLTGEGGMDFQTKFGKTPYGVAKIAQQYQKPVFACAGYIGQDVDVLYEEGITAIFGILSAAENLEAALLKGSSNLERTCENIARMLQVN